MVDTRWRIFIFVYVFCHWQLFLYVPFFIYVVFFNYVRSSALMSCIAKIELSIRDLKY